MLSTKNKVINVSDSCVLVVNQDLDARNQILKVLSKSGLNNLILAKDGIEAISVMKNRSIDVLITDIQFSTVDGWRLTRLVRSGVLKTDAAIPVIIVSSTYSERIANITASENEVNRFITHEKLNVLPSIITELTTTNKGLPKSKLLVIEDNPETSALIKRILGKQFAIDLADDGEKGLFMWKAGRHDLVLLDVMLPTMSGNEVLQKIIEINSNQAVVMMTAHGSVECATSLIINGAFDFISKPFRSEQIRKVCNIALRRNDYMLSNEQYAEYVEKIRSNEAKYRRLVECLKEDHFFYTRSPRGELTYVSPSVEVVLGYSIEEFKNNYSSYYTDNPMNKAAFDIIREPFNDSQLPPFELEVRAKDNSIRYLEINEMPIYGKKDSVTIDGIVHDVTQRFEAHAYLKQLADSTFEGIIIHDQGIIIQANQVFTELTGIVPSEIIGKKMYNLVIPEHREKVNNYICSQTEYLEGIQLLHVTGSSNPVEMRSRQIMIDGKSRSVAAIRDLSKQKQTESERAELQDQIRRSQKMDAIGQLTGGIAHDFNNILASILGFSHLLIQKLNKSDDEKTVKYATEIKKAGERARDLVKQMLSFSRGNSGAPRPLSIIRELDDFLSMLRPALPSTLDIQTDFTPDLPLIMMDQVQLHQLVMNIILNAKDAIPSGVGEIRVQLSSLVNPDFCCSSCYSTIKGNFIELRISDTGEGVSASNAEQIFNPFFTTKEVGKGTGMGLSVAHGIMHEHHGHIHFQSELGVGSIFSLLFPVIDGAPEVVEDELLNSDYEEGSGNILIVDDDKVLSFFLSELLISRGFNARVVNDPLEAIEFLEKHPTAIDLVLTDQTMPNIPGDVLATTILEKRPDMPIILCSGYSDRIDAVMAKKLNISGFLSKPIESNKLVSLVNRLILATAN